MVTSATVPKLNTLPVAIKQGLPPLRVAIYGDGGVGKTTLALSFPKPLVIDTDGGLEGDAIVGVTGSEWRPERWMDLQALYFWLKANVEKKGYQTIVLDSISELCVLILHEAMELPTKSRPAAAEYNQLIGAEKQDYAKVAYAVDSFLTKLKLLSKTHGVHIVITSGVREPDIELGRSRRTFDVQAAVENALTLWANIYGELVVVEKDGVESRTLWTRVADPIRKNKTRFAAIRPGVKNPTFTKLAGLIKGESE